MGSQLFTTHVPRIFDNLLWFAVSCDVARPCDFCHPEPYHFLFKLSVKGREGTHRARHSIAPRWERGSRRRPRWWGRSRRCRRSRGRPWETRRCRCRWWHRRWCRLHPRGRAPSWALWRSRRGSGPHWTSRSSNCRFLSHAPPTPIPSTLPPASLLLPDIPSIAHSVGLVFHNLVFSCLSVHSTVRTGSWKVQRESFPQTADFEKTIHF